jgi:FKBP-type peptidyl-prolyl cis-trans isomerase FklB
LGVAYKIVLSQKNQMSITDKLFNKGNGKAAANLKAGQEFLEANKSKAGVTTLPSGLQYEVITEGQGAMPKAANTVTCHYHGTLIDGIVFDSSVKRGQPASFPLNRVISGWTEGLQLMRVGSKWRFFIPADLGYGDRQVSAQIGPNSTLIFEVELLGIG